MMKCSEVNKILDMYINKELSTSNIDEKVKKHLEVCRECREYLYIAEKNRQAIKSLQDIQLQQYEMVKKDNRNFNNEMWAKIREIKEPSRVFPFVWLEAAIAIVFAIISLVNSSLLSKETLQTIGIILMAAGMIHTNYKEVETDE